MLDTRSIPAWAGETDICGQQALPSGVYPRVGGGNAAPRSQRRAAAGLSPRGRGKRLVIGAALYPARSIPAWAGETRYIGKWAENGEVYPRVGGGNHSRR